MTKVSPDSAEREQNEIVEIGVDQWDIHDRTSIEMVPVPEEYEPLPIRRSELVQMLDARRDVYAYVYVPIEGRQPARLGISAVHYVSAQDHIAIRTVPWYLGVERDEAHFTPWLTLTGDDIEHLLVDHDGVRLEAQDTKDETTAYPLAVGDCDGDGCDAEIEERSHLDELYEADERAPHCVLLISTAYSAGVLHCPSDERATVRIEAAR